MEKLNKLNKNGNGKGPGTPPLKLLKLKRLLCFKDEQWEDLNRLLNKEVGSRVKSRREYHKAVGKNCLIPTNVSLPYIPVEETARNLWELSTDEEHTWGDLSKEAEMRLKRILMGEDPI